MRKECPRRYHNGMTLQKKLVNVGSYRFTGKKLGKGNFARVEEAVHSILKIKVAVKIIDITQIKEEYILKNLEREAKIMSQLSHPSIVSLFQTMQNGNVYYLVTELITGGDLCTFIKSQKYGKLDERNTKVYARQLISALAHMHRIGIVHRDLKMENIMINSIRTQIKIVDFGLSNTYDSCNPLRTHCGSPEYAAPELFVPGKSYGPEVDTWSLGVIFFGMVVGQLPFMSPPEQNVTSQERRKKLLIQINKGYSNVQRKMLSLSSPELRSLVARMLITDASKRITIEELLNHPWVTDKSRKAVVVNPIPRLDESTKLTVMKEVGNLLKLEWRTVQYALNTEPNGDVAGTYNILVHKLYSQRLEGDGITKTILKQTNSSSINSQISTITKDSDKGITKKYTERVKSPFVHKFPKVSTDNVSRCGSANTQSISIDKRPQTSVGGCRTRKLRDTATAQSGQERPTLTADIRNRMMIETDLKNIKHAWYCPKTINYIDRTSKMVCDQINQQRPQTKLSKRIPDTSQSNTSSSYPIKNEVYVVGSKGLSKVLLKKKTEEQDLIRNSFHESSVLNRIKNKSDTITTSKRFIPSETPIKGSRLIEVKGRASDPKSVSSTSNQKNQQIKSRRVVTAKPIPKIELKRHEEGEKVQKPRPYSTASSKPTSNQRSILSDPIARSIAGYITKNMPNKRISRNI